MMDCQTLSPDTARLSEIYAHHSFHFLMESFKDSPYQNAKQTTLKRVASLLAIDPDLEIYEAVNRILTHDPNLYDRVWDVSIRGTRPQLIWDNPALE